LFSFLSKENNKKSNLRVLPPGRRPATGRRPRLCGEQYSGKDFFRVTIKAIPLRDGSSGHHSNIETEYWSVEKNLMASIAFGLWKIEDIWVNNRGGFGLEV